MIYGLALIAGLAITGTVIAKNNQKKETSTKSQPTQNYCPGYGSHYAYMQQMNDSTFMGHVRGMHNTYMMNHSNMNGTMMHQHQTMNNSGYCSY